ncbi:imm11 family protein [Methylosinus sporium]|uniref:imm11 family protein n=1 Tax=Methylosinus sporium TaxID=428 RepID=UPI00383B77E1
MTRPIYYEMAPGDWGGGEHCGLVVEPASKARAALWCGRGVSPQERWPDGYAKLPRHPYQFTDAYETPRLLILPRKSGKAPNDCFFYSGLWFISRRFKEAIEEIDPGACDIRPAETIMPDGAPGPEYYICSVTRMLEAKNVVDVERSEGLQIVQLPMGPPAYQMPSFSDIEFKALPNAIRFFRVAEFGQRVFCDFDTKNCLQAGKFKGVHYSRMGKR